MGFAICNSLVSKAWQVKKYDRRNPRPLNELGSHNERCEAAEETVRMLRRDSVTAVWSPARRYLCRPHERSATSRSSTRCAGACLPPSPDASAYRSCDTSRLPRRGACAPCRGRRPRAVRSTSPHTSVSPLAGRSCRASRAPGEGPTRNVPGPCPTARPPPRRMSARPGPAGALAARARAAGCRHGRSMP